MSKKNQKLSESPKFLFDRKKYILLIISLFIIFIGFLLMSGGGSDDPNVFDESIFSFRRIKLAPIVLFIGYGLIFYTIMKGNNTNERILTFLQKLPQNNRIVKILIKIFNPKK